LKGAGGYIKMKVLVLNTNERIGGAAIAANRLMKALNKSGIEAKTLVLNKQTDDDNVVSVQSSFIKRQLARWFFLWERVYIFVYNRFSKNNLFKVSIANTGFDIAKHPLVREADIIHLHWVNQGFLSLKSIYNLIQSGKLIVWTMHDLWAATGICHHPRSCEKNKDICFNCDKLNGNISKDLAYRTFEKKKTLDLHLIHYVGCSRWIAEQAGKSRLLQSASICSIPNPIDTRIFTPQNKDKIRKKLQLPVDKRLLLFSAANFSDKNKGGQYFVEACKMFYDSYPEFVQSIEIVLMGKGNETVFSALKMPIHTLHYISDDSVLADVYAAVDAFVTPSLEENLPNTIMESMACGVPCIGFNTGGIPEMIDHKINGYVTRYASVEDLTKGIYWTLFESDCNQLSINARQKALNCYSEEVVAKQYIKLFLKIK